MIIDCSLIFLVDDKSCIYLFGPASEENPNGLELTILTKNKKERDHLIQVFIDWRDAATYGF